MREIKQASTSSRYSFLALVSLLTILVGIFSTPQLASVQNLVLSAIAPVQSGVTSVTTTVTDFVDTLQQLDQLKKENAQLHAQVNQLVQQNVQFAVADRENAALRTQLHYKQIHPELQLLPAQIIAHDPNNLLFYITIDKGSRDGIQEGMSVIAPEGLVGRISSIGPNWSKVLLIISPTSSVDAILLRSRSSGVVDGRNTGPLRMRYIPQNQQITKPDYALTSGLGGAFPRGLIIGRLTKVQNNDSDLFQEATVEPLVNFSRLEQVLIVTNFVPIKL